MFGLWQCECREYEKESVCSGGVVAVGDMWARHPSGGKFKLFIRLGEGGFEAGVACKRDVEWPERKMRRRLEAVSLKHWRGCERKGSGGFHGLLKGVVR